MKKKSWLAFCFCALCCLLYGVEEAKSQCEFRNYEEAKPHVREFYKEQHLKQTLEFARGKVEEYGQLNHGEYGVWEVLELLNELVDESDPDIELEQIHHALQTAEAIRKDGLPDWMVLTGLIHDLGKLLTVFGEPQWAVVGDIYPLGCGFSDKIVLSEYFRDNPDAQNEDYLSRLGIYEESVGLDNVTMTWGHDEYLYRVVRDQSLLPQEAKFIIHYHSFYALHREGEYLYLLNEEDKENLEWLRKFNPYDLYSKSDDILDIEELKPYYEELIKKYFPEEKIRW